MDTKICKGILHSEGVELPIEDFRFCKHTRVVKSNCKRLGRQFIKGEITIYYLRYTLCKKCESARNLKYQKNHIEQTIHTNRRFQRSKRGRDLHNKARNRWRLKNKDRENLKNRLKRKECRENLSYTYVHFLWNLKFKKYGIDPPEFTNDIWLAERIRISAVRRMRQTKLKQAS